jgi:hypothetical protein
MESTVKWLIGILLAGLVFPLLYYYLTNEKPNVRYEISQGIPTKFVTNNNNDTSFFFQEVNIQNYGNKKAEKIVVKVAKNVVSYDILKYSELDSIETKKNKNQFELHYNELVPGGKFRLILKVFDPVNSASISVFSTTGECKQIEKKSLGFYISGIFSIVWLVFILTTISTAILYMKDDWKRHLRYADVEKLFTTRKPFWVNKIDWIQELRKTFEYLIKNDYWHVDIKESVSYKVLDYESRGFSLNKNLDDILNIATSKIEDLLLATGSFLNEYKIQYHLNIAKPSSVNTNKWEEIQTKLQKKYIAHLKNESLSFYSMEQYEQEFEKLDTLPINTEMKKQYEHYLCNNYIREFLNIRTTNSGFYNKLLTSNYKKYLDEDTRKKIENITYQMQLASFEYEMNLRKVDPIKFEKENITWIAPKDLLRIKRNVYERALHDTLRLNPMQLIDKIENKELEWLKASDKKNIIEDANLKQKSKKGEILFDSLNKLLSGQYLLSEKPVQISDIDWEIIMTIQKRIIYFRQNSFDINRDSINSITA